MTFEESVPVLDEMLSLYRNRWTLQAINYDDVAQTIRLHVMRKWHLFDQTKDIRPWLARLIQRQIKNLLRNEYYNYLPPCRRCPMYLGESRCKMYGSRLKKCSLYRNYLNNKKEKESIRFAVSYETIPYDGRQSFAYDVEALTQSIGEKLTGTEKQIFILWHESGFSLTKITQTLKPSGVPFSKMFEVVKQNLRYAKEVALETLEEQKIVMGHKN